MAHLRILHLDIYKPEIVKSNHIFQCISWTIKHLISLMHGITMKITEAQKTKLCNIYKNTRLKLLKHSSSRMTVPA